MANIITDEYLLSLSKYHEKGTPYHVGLNGDGPMTGLAGATGIYLSFSSLEEAFKEVEAIRNFPKNSLINRFKNLGLEGMNKC